MIARFNREQEAKRHGLSLIRALRLATRRVGVGVANAGVKVQVRRWQDAASLARSDDDILEVSRYLNESIYHFVQSADPTASSSLVGNAPISTLTRPSPHRLAYRP